MKAILVTGFEGQVMQIIEGTLDAACELICGQEGHTTSGKHMKVVKSEERTATDRAEHGYIPGRTWFSVSFDDGSGDGPDFVMIPVNVMTKGPQ